MHEAGVTARPPQDEIPAAVRLALVLARGPSCLLVFSEVAVFTNGFIFTTSLLIRGPANGGLLDEWSTAWEPRSRDHGFELVIRYGDGRRQGFAPGEASQGITPFVFLRGWSDDAQVSRTAFASPVPPGGDVTVACGWERHGMGRTVSSFQASLLLDARRAVLRPWDA